MEYDGHDEQLVEELSRVNFSRTKCGERQRQSLGELVFQLFIARY